VIPKVKFLRRPHACNYCQGVHGLTYNVPGKVEARLLWVRCGCGKSHYVCRECAFLIGSVLRNGVKMIAECAKGYSRKKSEAAASSGQKGESDAETRRV